MSGICRLLNMFNFLFRRENQDQIKKNRNKLSKEEEYLEDLIEMEREITEQVGALNSMQNIRTVNEN